MLQITTMEGTTITGSDRVELVAKLADHDHSVTWGYIEALELYDLRPAEEK